MIRYESIEFYADPFIGEVSYVSCDALSGGDYGGAGYIARVNCESLAEEFYENSCEGLMGYRGLTEAVEHDAFVDDEGKLVLPTFVTLKGAHGSYEGYLLATPEALEIVNALEDYPVWDEDALSEYEMAALDDEYDYLIDIIRDEATSAAEDIGCEECLSVADTEVLVSRIVDLDDETVEAMARDHLGDSPFEPEHDYTPNWRVREPEELGAYIARTIREEDDLSARGVALRHHREELTTDMLKENV